MPTGTHGFGSLAGPELAELDSMPMPEELGDPLVDSAQYLKRIAEKYDGQPVEDITPFNLTVGASFKRDFSQTPFSSIVVSAATGTVEMFFGDYTQPALNNTVGYYTVPSGGAPFELLLATLGHVVTILNRSSNATGAVGCTTISRP